MGKPSITNIRPPSKSPDPIWTPPKTYWDLDTADWGQAVNAGWAATNNSGDAVGGDAQFDTLVGKINTESATQAGDVTDVSQTTMTNDNVVDGIVYDYVFFGVNGGEDETVVGKREASGIIVTGNGKDNITGGNKADLIFSGNGKDTVDGGGGNDILFGENGPDTLNGGKDEGSASVTEIPGEGDPPPTVTLANYKPSDDDGSISPGEGHFQENGQHEGDYVDNSGSLQKVGIAAEGGEFFQVFSFDPMDLAPEDELNPVTVAAYIYGPGFSGTPELIGTYTLMENEQVSFSVNMNDHPQGGIVVVFQVPVTQAMLDNPQGQSSLKTQAFDGYDAAGESEFVYAFEAGDELIGGNGNDTFVWDANDTVNVDLIWDYNQASGVYDATEGDVLLLKNVDPDEALVTFMTDIDGDTVDDLVIYFGEDQAIGLVGITDIAQVTIQYA